MRGVTTGVLLASTRSEDGGLAAALPWGNGTLLGRLAEQLAELGVGSVHVVTRQGFEQALRSSFEGLGIAVQLHVSTSSAGDLRTIAAVAANEEGDLLVASADVVTHREALAGLLADPRVSTAALCAAREVAGPLSPAVRVTQGGRIVSAGSAYHSVSNATGRFLGVVKVADLDRGGLAEVAGKLAAHATTEPVTESAAAEDASSLALVGLVRSGVHVGAVELRHMYWARPPSRQAAERAAWEIHELDEDRLMLDSAVKANDSFFTTFFVSPYSKYLARWAARRGWTPNQITTVSLAIGVLAAIAFAAGDRAGLIAGAILLQVSFATDCVDGQLARYTRNFSPLGAWLDAVFDRTKEYLVYAGLAIGASRTGDPVWVLAGSALALQTVRHAIDFSYLIVEREQIAGTPRPALEEPSDRPASSAREHRQGSPAGAWDRFNRLAGIRWAKQFIAFPIGERFVAISIAAAVGGARTTFLVLLAWGGFATAYKMTGRLMRSVLR